MATPTCLLCSNRERKSTFTDQYMRWGKKDKTVTVRVNVCPPHAVEVKGYADAGDKFPQFSDIVKWIEARTPVIA